MENEKKELNIYSAIEAIVKAYNDGVLLSEDAEAVERCIIEALDNEYNILTGSSLILDFNGMGFNENLLNVILCSIRDYPECNEPLVKGYSDCWWLFDNDGCSNSLETFSNKSDWIGRCTEIFLDNYSYEIPVGEIFNENLDIEALVREYELEVESDDDE